MKSCVRLITITVLSLCSIVAFAADEPSPLANSDPNYRALRNATLTEAFEVADLTIKRDAGSFRLNGKVSFAAPVAGKVMLGVFTGRGEFIIEPALPWERRNLLLHINEPSVTESFDAAVFRFSDATYEEIKAAGQPSTVDSQSGSALDRHRSAVRDNREVPRSNTEAMLSGEDVDNIEASLLAEILNPAREGSFSAYIHGAKYSDLRFIVRPNGALPQLLSAEEVALINFNPGSPAEGVWYLAHKETEYAGGMPSGEPVFLIDTKHYRLDTVIKANHDISATCEMTFSATADGERVLRFSLLPTLRVSSVRSGDGKELSFIQEAKRSDGSFYVIFPEALQANKEYSVAINYSGDEVIRSEGGGNFAVGARTSWYPSVNSFQDRATFDLTFHYPKRFELVSVGDLQGKPQQVENEAVSNWKSETPLAVAGFNYGSFTKKEVQDKSTKYLIEGYATSEVPDILVRHEALPQLGRAANSDSQQTNMSPKRMMDTAIGEAQASIQLFTGLYGALPYGRVAITQQPQLYFGQSWPSLVYLPVIAFLDSTQRWSLFGAGTGGVAQFVQEVTAHEVAHQWWGHIVGWESYHDQWLSEGLADFSAGLFLQATRKSNDDYLRFLERWRDAITQKNEFGFSPNDVGPLWMGRRLSTPRTGDAYSRLVYPKGGYVVHMLRWMMFDMKTGDEAFSAMMKDFVTTHHNKNASTENFQAVVEKHMQPSMDLAGDGKMDWFFKQWVYGTQIPSYDLQYRYEQGQGGQVTLVAKISQRGVSDDFRMAVPIYIELDGRLTKLGALSLVGNTTTAEFQVPLPKQPTRVLLNAHHDILAAQVTASAM